MTTPCLRKFFALAVAGFLCQGFSVENDRTSSLSSWTTNPCLISRYTTPLDSRHTQSRPPRQGRHGVGRSLPHGSLGGESARSRHMVMSGRMGARPGQAGPRHEPACYQPQEGSARSGSIYSAGSLQPGRLRHHATCKNGNSYEAANKLFTVRHDGTRRGGTDETGSHWHGEQVMNYLKER